MENNAIWLVQAGLPLPIPESKKEETHHALNAHEWFYSIGQTTEVRYCPVCNRIEFFIHDEIGNFSWLYLGKEVIWYPQSTLDFVARVRRNHAHSY